MTPHASLWVRRSHVGKHLGMWEGKCILTEKALGLPCRHKTQLEALNFGLSLDEVVTAEVLFTPHTHEQFHWAETLRLRNMWFMGRGEVSPTFRVGEFQITVCHLPNLCVIVPSSSLLFCAPNHL